MLDNMAMSSVPSFITQMIREKGDALMWDMYLHKYDGELSFADFRKEQLRSAGTGMTEDEKRMQETEALDFASQFISFAKPK